MNLMKYLRFIMVVPLLMSIQSCPNKNDASTKIFACPKEPTIKLENPEKIDLASATKIIDGMVGNGSSVGYKFTGKKNQKINYQIQPNNTCIWLYDPNNKIVNVPILPEDGTYILQIASAEGSRTFQLELSINSMGQTPKPTVSERPPSPLVSIQPIPKDRPSPEEAIKNHYQLINDKNIDDSWKDLSDSFKGSNLTKGEKEYKEWWNQVKTINVNSITQIRQDRDRAIVKVRLTYTLNTGRVVDDTRDKIYLIWDDSKQKWLINDKR
jgi:hypothetical protein